MGKHGGGIVAAVLVLIAAGCTSPATASPPSSPPLSPTRSASFTCIDDGVRTAGPCSRADYDAQQAEQATFTEAQQVYARFLTERNRLAHEGGADQPTDVMKQTAIDPYLGDIMKSLRRQREFGITSHGDITAHHLRIERGKSMSGSTFAIWGCEDGSAVTGTMRDGSAALPGSNTWVSLFFKRVGNQLVIVDADGDEEPSCGK